jgi:transmembrane sensor
VQIKSISSGQQKMLKPGQQASVNNGSLTTAHVNVDNIISWKNGYFLFDNQDVKEIMQVMSRWYDVDISYQGAITNERFGGSFSRKLRMNEILKNFERLGNLEFDVYGNQVLVRPKKIN